MEDRIDRKFPFLLVPAEKKKPLVEILNLTRQPLSKGATTVVSLPVTVQKGFHVQANPASQKRLIPTTLKLITKDGVSVGTIKYPKGKPYRLKGGTSDMSVYEGTFKLSFPVTLSLKAKAGKMNLSGKLRYQACNDLTCFFPKSIPVEIPVWRKPVLHST